MGSFRLPNGDNYTGQFNEACLKDGVGRYTWKQAQIEYSGEWKSDQMSGKGQITYQNGDVYRGSFSENNFHGEGQYFFADNGGSLKGTFNCGQLEGKAIYNASNGQSGKENSTQIKVPPESV